MLENDKSCNEFLIGINTQIKYSQQRVLLAVNKELILLHQNIKSSIKRRWGS